MFILYFIMFFEKKDIGIIELKIYILVLYCMYYYIIQFVNVMLHIYIYICICH